ncbi:MAG: hypothetical protein ACJAZB_000804 [Psychrosphaera sp.]|jgi:hypothetical protein
MLSILSIKIYSTAQKVYDNPNKHIFCLLIRLIKGFRRNGLEEYNYYTN